MADDFDSSDYGSEPESSERPFAHLGAKSIEAMFETRIEDRRKTKKRMANLQDTSGAMTTVRYRALVMNRFEGYLTKARGLSVQYKPTGDDVARFVETVTGKMVSNIANKPAPSLKTLRQNIWALCSALSFKHDFQLTRQESKRIDTVLGALVREGKLTTGTWRKRERVGLVLLCKMSQAWFTKSLTHGCRSWDVIISKILPLSLMAATSSRAGDITRSQGYKGIEYMRWEHVELILESDNEPDVNKMVARITIAYEKGKKNALNEDKVVVVGALDDVQHNTICPIKLLLIHGLRSGHIAHPSINSLLKSLLLIPNRRVQWQNASDPIIPAVKQGMFLDFSRPATTDQLNNTIKTAGLLAGILVPLVSHDIRAGAARDISKLRKDSIKGVADTTVAKALGHNYKTLANGTTDSYVGGIDTAINVAVASQEPRADRFGPPAVEEGYIRQLRTPSARVTEVCIANGLDSTKKAGRRKAAAIIEKENQEQWANEQTDLLSREAPQDVAAQSRKQKSPTTPTIREPLAEKSSNVRPQKKQRKEMNKPGGDDGTTGGGLDAVQNKTRSTPTGIKEHVPAPLVPTPDELIDPQLRDFFDAGDALHETGVEENMFDSHPVDAAQISTLESLISDGSPEGVNMDDSRAQVFEERLAEQAIIDALDEVVAEDGDKARSSSNKLESAIELNGTPFVDHFSKINIVRNKTLASGEAKDYSKHVPTGNSRDEPTLFQIPCPNAALGCEYTSPLLAVVNHHTMTRNCIANQPDEQILARSADNHPCPRDGCDKSYATEASLSTHIKNTHDWTPKTCGIPDCPQASVLWSDGGKYQRHMTKEHSEDWTPTKCQVPDCKSSTTFSSRALYSSHLEHIHKLFREEKQKFLPRKVSGFVPQKCPIGGCRAKEAYGRRHALVTHLKNVHKIQDGEIESMIA